MAENAGDTIHLGVGGSGGIKQRRPRLRLNCSECRGKKLSCDRKLPCQRCVRAGKPDLCTYEAFPPGTRPSPGARPSAGFNDNDFGGPPPQQNDDQIRELQAEIAQLKEHLLQTTISHTNPEAYGDIASSLPTLVHVTSDSGSDGHATSSSPVIASDHTLGFIQRFNKAYHGSSTLLQLFYDLPQLPPFVRTLSEEHLKSRGIYLSRTHYPTEAPNSNINITHLVALLPPKEDVDALVSFYLNHAEHVHRIVHIPTFEREYLSFWLQEPQLRDPAVAALILSIISIAISTSNLFPNDSHYRPMVPHWISVSAQWLGGQWQSQPPNPRTLVYYQLSCLVYLAKRLTWVRRRPFWTETAALIQNAIMDGLHIDPPDSESLYMREMRRRIWSTLRELDLQASFDYSLPTILHSLESTTLPPSNLNDSDFDENSKTFPAPRPPTEYTQTSYQIHSAQNFNLRLEVSHRLFAGGRGNSTALPYSEVLGYTKQLSQALDSLPGWTAEAGVVDNADNGGPRKVTLMVWAFLQYQLKECLILLHWPFVHPIPSPTPTEPQSSSPFPQTPPPTCLRNSSSSLSETILYQNALSILLLTRRLAVLGAQCMTLMRNDLTLACLTLCLVTLSRPKGSLSIPIVNINQTVGLLEDMLPVFEAWFLRSSHIYSNPLVHLDHHPSLSGHSTGADGLNHQMGATTTPPCTIQTQCVSPGQNMSPSITTNTPAAWRVLMIYSVLIVSKIHVGKDDEARAYPCCANRFSGFWNSHIDRRVESGMMSNINGVGGGNGASYELESAGIWQHASAGTTINHLHGESSASTMSDTNPNSNNWNFEIGASQIRDPFSLEIEQAGW